MSTHYHDPWEDGVTEYKAADMNAPLAQLDQAINDIRGPENYDFIGQYLASLISNGALLMQAIVGRYMYLPSGAAGSQLYAATAPTGSAQFTIKRNGSTIGTATIGVGGNWASFSVSSDVAFYNGDLLQLYGPASQDATLKDVSWNMIMTREDVGSMTTTTTT